MISWKKLASLTLSTALTVPLGAVAVPTASAETVKMSWKPMDKAYVSIIIDDNNSELKALYELITLEYGFPLCAAVPANTVKESNKQLLHDIENHGGEILAHNLTHKVFNRDVPWSTVDYELGEAYRRLTAEGFNVHGVIGCGGGGTEDSDEEYRKMLEPYTSKYYQYSDYYGASTQYYKSRKWLYGGLGNIKSAVNRAITNKGWEVVAAHGLTHDVAGVMNEKIWRAFLDFLKEKQDAGELEVVTYRTVHKTFGDWAKPVDLGEAKYTVDFYSTDNKTLLGSAVAVEGKAATAPNVYGVDGATFTGWSGKFDKVTGNTRVYATATKNGAAVKLTDPAAVQAVEEHTHNWGKQYAATASGHYRACACGEKEPLAAHIAGPAATETAAQTCTVCGYVMKPALGVTEPTEAKPTDAKPTESAPTAAVTPSTTQPTQPATDSTAPQDDTPADAEPTEKTD